MHTRTRRLTGKTEWLIDQSETTASIQFTTHVQVQSTIVHSHLIKYNVLILSHPFSSSKVSLYGPPLNQLCQDDLPLTSNTPLYQSQVPFSGVHLLNHARMTYSVQLNVLYATHLSTDTNINIVYFNSPPSYASSEEGTSTSRWNRWML